MNNNSWQTNTSEAAPTATAVAAAARRKNELNLI